MGSSSGAAEADRVDEQASYLGTVGLVLLAPLSVVVVLEALGNVVAAFLIYHGLVCLVLPAVDSMVLRRRSLREHLAYVGVRPGQAGAWLAGGLGFAVMAAATLGPFLLAGDALLGTGDLAASLATWGLPAGNEAAFFVYMLVSNSIAEELFWRGHVHQRLARWDRRGAAVGLVTLAFASYHTYTIQALVGDPLVTGLLTLGVFIGGLLWAVLREYYDTVYPAVLAHMGATLGYMTVYVRWVA